MTRKAIQYYPFQQEPTVQCWCETFEIYWVMALEGMKRILSTSYVRCWIHLSSNIVQSSAQAPKPETLSTGKILSPWPGTVTKLYVKFTFLSNQHLMHHSSNCPISVCIETQSAVSIYLHRLRRITYFIYKLASRRKFQVAKSPQ